MTEIIVTFKIKDFENPSGELTSEDITDMLREIAEKEQMDLVSWGTV